MRFLTIVNTLMVPVLAQAAALTRVSNYGGTASSKAEM